VDILAELADGIFKGGGGVDPTRTKGTGERTKYLHM
jgi:hypothetical protein